MVVEGDYGQRKLETKENTVRGGRSSLRAEETMTKKDNGRLWTAFNFFSQRQGVKGEDKGPRAKCEGKGPRVMGGVQRQRIKYEGQGPRAMAKDQGTRVEARAQSVFAIHCCGIRAPETYTV